MDVKILDQKNETVAQNTQKDVKKNLPLIPFHLDVEELNIQKSSFNSLGNLDVQNVNIQIKNVSNKVEEHLLVEELQLNNPEFIHIPSKEAKKQKSNNKLLNDVVLIDKIKINDAVYTLKDQKGTYNKLTVNGINLSLENIRVDDQTILGNIPFTYKNPELSTNRIHFNAGRSEEHTSELQSRPHLVCRLL